MVFLNGSPTGCVSGKFRRSPGQACFPLALALGLAGITWFASAAVAEDEPPEPGAADVRSVEPFIGETTLFILKLVPEQMELPSAGALLPGGTEPTEQTEQTEQTEAAKKFSQRLSAFLAELRKLADGQPIYATVGIPQAQNRWPVFLFRAKTSAENSERVMGFVTRRLRGQASIQEQFIVAVLPGGRLSDAGEVSDARRQAIASAFAAVAPYPVQLLIVPPDHVRRTVEELSPELPSFLGGGPSSVLTKGVLWAGIGFDPQRLRIEIVIQSSDEQAARDLAARLPKMLRSLYEAAEPIHSRLPEELAVPVLDLFEPRVEANQVIVQIEGSDAPRGNLAFAHGLAQLIGEHSRRPGNYKRLRQILLGMHNYHDVHKSFPPPDRQRDKEGKPYLSWRVHILPFLEESPLYDQFRLDEPWDSPHNKKLLDKMPAVYAPTGPIGSGEAQEKVQPGYTTIVAPAGEKAIFGGTEATRFRQITDGMSNTVAVLEVVPGRAVPWTAPDDYAFDPEAPLKGVLVGGDGTWMSAFADGSVRQLPANLPKETVLHLFQMNDGKLVNLGPNR